jgi:NADP-dependent 3-hydroxy acid dehydrogenase YdfG
MNIVNVLITGASSGFGKLTTLSLVDKGYKVWASMRDVKGKNSSIADELKQTTSDAQQFRSHGAKTNQ